MIKPFSCPICQARHQPRFHAVKWIVCDHCQHVLSLSADTVVDFGESPMMFNVEESRLTVGDKGVLRSREFEVINHIYCCDTDQNPLVDYWEEWLLYFADDTYGSLEYESGIFSYSAEKKLITHQVSPFEKIAIGDTLKIDQFSGVVLEKNVASIYAGRGQHFHQITVPNTIYRYIDLSSHHYRITIEYIFNEVYLYYGIPIDPDTLIVHR